jgi:site-specific recombinase XerD
VQAGVDLYTVKELLGHSEIVMTERYSHLAPDNLRDAVEKVAV